MKTFTTRSAWSWLREDWLNPPRIRFWLVVVTIMYPLVGFLLLPWVASSFAVSRVADDLGRDLRIGAAMVERLDQAGIDVANLSLEALETSEIWVENAWVVLF